MTHKPFFSIITASYNADRTIDKTIRSIKKQTFKNYEHIVVDGGSKDQTLSILTHHSGSYPLRYVSEDDHGVADAMNKGVHISTGEYIVFIHADDELADASTLQGVFNDMTRETSKVYAYAINFVARNGSHIARPIRIPFWYKLRNTIPHQGAFVHRDIFRKYGTFDTSFSISMDYKLFYAVLLAKEPVVYSNTIVSNMGSQGISSDRNQCHERLKQDFRIQNTLETSLFWKWVHLFFQYPYYLYKTQIVPRIKQSGNQAGKE
ncbi:glycosyltransferase family 2 protein [Desulfoluna butyratoxydans]|uniref:Nucleotide-diphospho-sugar transferases n=1 Tax=Desulfoluna butyratoxydans TaxID=231438 RepID=A0A4U8YTI3_9BACT|nr:glycosyltransferase family 2 protein [Desulfoluna butyratoxydans]VFQ47290.1 nucleotide-diphospho-sugar transferases [Desulfoluna butyratoxydans]